MDFRERIAKASFNFTLQYQDERGLRVGPLAYTGWENQTPIQKKFGFALADYLIKELSLKDPLV